jgi:hypothetical protein
VKKEIDYKKSKAQSMIELVILGPLVLVAAGVLITYTAKVNNDQYFLMEAFRYALKKSHDLNKPTGYGVYDDRMQVSINRPAVGEEMVSGGAGYAMWAVPCVQDGKQEDSQNQIWVKANDWGDLPGLPNEREATEAGSTSIESTAFIGTGEGVNVNINNGVAHSSRSGGAGGGYIYKVGKKMYMGFIRGHGAARSFTAHVGTGSDTGADSDQDSADD